MKAARFNIEMVLRDLDEILAGNGRVLIKRAQELAKHLGKDPNMTTSKIRKVFSEIQKMDKFDRETEYKLQILRSKLAYTAGRHPSVRDLQAVLDPAIEKIDDPDKLRFFKDFFEAVVAYHKQYERE